jgi:hypothetical protein
LLTDVILPKYAIFGNSSPLVTICYSTPMLEQSPRLDFDAMGAQQIARETVALSYLQGECAKIFDAPVVDGLAQLDAKYLWRMFEAMSQTYRVNDVFRIVSNEGYDWYKLTAPVESIAMTGIRPDIDAIVASDAVQRNPVLFAKYMQEYVAAHPDDDPQNLKEFQQHDIPENQQVLMAREQQGSLYMLDGSHRLISLVSMGSTAIDLYAARQNGQPEIARQGDSTFNTMKRLFKTTDSPADRAAIMRVTALLMQQSTDGERAVEWYWVGDTAYPDLQQAGQDLLDRDTERHPGLVTGSDQ